MSKTEMRVVYTPKGSAGITVYETSDEHVIYDSTRMTDDIYFKRIRHMNTEYKKGDHMSGEIIEVLTGLNIGISSFEIPKTEQPSFDFIYNVSENMLYTDGEWRKATKEDIADVIEEIKAAISMTAETTVEQMIKPGTKLSFAPTD